VLTQRNTILTVNYVTQQEAVLYTVQTKKAKPFKLSVFNSTNPDATNRFSLNC